MVDQGARTVVHEVPRRVGRGRDARGDGVLSPRAALDGAAFQAAAKRGTPDAELVDLREEMAMTRWATDEAERKEFLTAMRAAGVRDDGPVVVYDDGLQTRDFTFVGDAVAANLLALERGEPGGAYNVGGGSRVSVNDSGT